MRNAMTEGANTILQSHVMSFLTFKKTRTADDIIRVAKTTSNADTVTLASYNILS